MRIMLANFAKMHNDSGGLAKVTVAFANEMVRRGHDVSLLYCDEHAGEFFYPLSKKVCAYNICYQNDAYVKMPLWMKIKREVLRPLSAVRSRDVNDDFMRKYLLDEVGRILEIEKPDIIVSSQPAASRIMLCDIDTNVPVITMSHGDPEDYFHIYPKGEIPAVEKSAVCQVLLSSFVEHIKSRFPKQKVVVIGNVVPQYEKRANLQVNKKRYKIVFIGRMVKNHKRPHLLIKAFAKLAKKYPQWDLELWGAESNKAYTNSLHRLIEKNGLQERTKLMGITKDVASVLEKGDIFVLPSAYEGFGLSLAEAMSMGLPVIGYKKCSAVNELIVDGENGYLCEEGVEPLAAAMEKLINDKGMRVAMGNNARVSVKKYAADNIWNDWEQLMTETINDTRKYL